VEYESRSGLIKLLHRLGLEYQKPEVIGRHLDEAKQRAFIDAYDKLLNSLGPDEAVLFVDAVHPTHAARPVGCWTASRDKLAIEQTSGRQRLNIHGAIDLETGHTRMIEAETIEALSTIRLLESIEALYPLMALIHVFLDNARYHHAKLVQEWLARPDCRIRLHFVPAYCPHLNPIERLWGSDAQEHNAQQVLRNLQGLRRGDARLPTPRRTQAMARISKRRHRQFPHHKPQGFSGRGVNRVYLVRGKVKIAVTSEQGKEAVVGLFGEGDFFGEGCLIGQPVRLATATSMSDTSVMRIEKAEMIRVLHAEPAFAERFTAHLLTRNSRVEADLVDQLFNSSERRLARTLLLLANFGKEGRPEPITTRISQETLAEMVGTTRPRVSFFMNKFRKL